MSDKELKIPLKQHELEDIFDLLFDDFLIDVPSDFFEEDVGFHNDPEELSKIFTKLEEDNLTLIHTTQDL